MYLSADMVSYENATGRQSGELSLHGPEATARATLDFTKMMRRANRGQKQRQDRASRLSEQNSPNVDVPIRCIHSGYNCTQNRYVMQYCRSYQSAEFVSVMMCRNL